MTSPMSSSIDAAGATGPVFIVGMNGSGTTMLLHSLGNHPDLYGFKRETRVLPYFIAHLHRYGNLDDDDNCLRLMRDIYALRAFRQQNGGHPVPLPEDWATMPRDLASIVDTAFRYFAMKEHKNRWADKTPMHALHITELARLFPPARFVHVIRDGRDSAASFHRRWHRTPEVTIHRWKTVVREARRQGMGDRGSVFRATLRGPDPGTGGVDGARLYLSGTSVLCTRLAVSPALDGGRKEAAGGGDRSQLR